MPPRVILISKEGTSGRLKRRYYHFCIISTSLSCLWCSEDKERNLSKTTKGTSLNILFHYLDTSSFHLFNICISKCLQFFLFLALFSFSFHFLQVISHYLGDSFCLPYPLFQQLSLPCHTCPHILARNIVPYNFILYSCPLAAFLGSLNLWITSNKRSKLFRNNSF